jgi:5-methylcytosine-specific restriction protein A
MPSPFRRLRATTTRRAFFAAYAPAYGRISLYGVLSRRSMHARNLAPAQTLHWSRWYGLQLWFTIRDHQLAKEPLCAFCLKAGQVTPATVADHIEPHGGDWNKFRTSALQSLCGPCHEEKHGRLSPTSRLSKEVDDNGYPVDPAHPFNKVRPARG